MRWLSDCSEDMSREHYLSEGVLREIESPPGNGLDVSGFYWSDRGEPRPYGLASLVSRRVFCERHNQALGPVDDAAARMFRGLHALTTDKPANKRETRLNGHDVERWMLKTVLGLLASQSVPAGDGTLALDRTTLRGVCHLLQDPLVWNTSRLQGMWSMGTSFGVRLQKRVTVRLHIIEPGRLGGATFDLGSCRFFLALSPRLRDWLSEPSLWYHPTSVVIKSGGCASTIRFVWENEPSPPVHHSQRRGRG